MPYVYSFGLLCIGLLGINLIYSYQSQHINPHLLPILRFQIQMIPLFFLTNVAITYGIKFGFEATKQLGFVLLSSKCIEILVALLMGYLFFKEIPNWRTWIGLTAIVGGVIFMRLK